MSTNEKVEKKPPTEPATAIKKVEIHPVVPTVLKHHRELPTGRYMKVLSGFGSKINLLQNMNSGAKYLIDWQGNVELRDDFEVTAEGDLVSYVFEKPSYH